MIDEPGGGAHHSPDEAARIVGEALARHLAPLCALSTAELLEERYRKYRALGRFVERVTAEAAASSSGQTGTPGERKGS